MFFYVIYWMIVYCLKNRYTYPVYELTIVMFTKIISTGGFAVAALIVCGILLWRRRRVEAGIFFISTVGLMLSTQILKLYFHIPRPPDALVETSGYAFPSGHAGGVMFLALCLAYLVKNVPQTERYRLWTILASGVLLVGISRVLLGVHTPFQIVAGYVLGAVWAGVYVYLVRRFCASET